MKKWIATILTFISITTTAQEFEELASGHRKFTAGTKLTLTLEKNRVSKGADLAVVFDNGMVRMMILDSGTDDTLSFTVPESIMQRSGTVTARLFDGDRLLNKSEFEIVPDNTQVKAVESYCGPKHLVADRNDESMIVSTALDQYDNPLKEYERIEVFYHRENAIEEYKMNMRPLFGYRRLQAGIKSGFGTVLARKGSVSGKSFRLDYYQIGPADFSVNIERQHAYADGEQVVNLYTTPIRGTSGDLIGNGTLVNFIIRDSEGAVSQLQGYTVSGVARVMRYAPEKGVTWAVTAIVPGYAGSRTTKEVKFLPSVTDFELTLQGSEIEIGPVKGYLGQWVKKGMRAEFTVKGKDFGTKFYRILENGRAALALSELNIPAGNYTLSVTIAGITKQTEIKKHD